MSKIDKLAAVYFTPRLNKSIAQYMRDTWDITSPEYTCLRGPRPSGALIVTNLLDGLGNRTIYGVVRPPKNTVSCMEAGQCMMEDGHCVRCNHAEVDALIVAAKMGISTIDSVMFSINKPCYACTRAIIAAGISTVYYAFAVYDEERTRIAAEAAGLEMFHVAMFNIL